MPPLTLTPRTPGSLSASTHTAGTFPPSAIHAGDLPWFNPLDYGAAGDGVTDDTVAIQAAHDAAFLVGGEVMFPALTFLCGTINWRYVSMRGEGRRGSVIKGLPSQDILHVSTSDLNFSYPGWHIRDLKFILNDTVDASASFPQRGGVGNAVFACDYANGAVSTYPAPYQGEFKNIWLESSSLTVNGRNNTAGFFLQYGPIQCLFSNVRIWRFVYGFREAYPTSNLTSVELAPDHNRYESVFFDHCERQMRLVNEDSTSMSNVVLHGTTPLSGLEMIDVTSQIRSECANFDVNRLYIEQHAGRPMTITGKRHNFKEVLSYQTTASAQTTAPPLIACDQSVFKSCSFGAKGVAQLTVTGNRNEIQWWPVYDNSVSPFWASTDTVTDTGYANQIVKLGTPSGANPRRRSLEGNSLGYRILHQRDSVSGLFGHVNPAFVSGADLIINPREWQPSYFGTVEGGSSNGDFSYVTDTTSDFGMVIRSKDGQFNLVNDYANGTYAIEVGKFVPKSKVRMYIRAKSVGTGGSHTVTIDQGTPGGTNITSSSLTWTTSYTSNFIDLDLSAITLGTGLAVYAGSLGRDLDISSVIFRPYFADLLVVGSGVANPDTSGATLPQLETEVNELKAMLRAVKLLAT